MSEELSFCNICMDMYLRQIKPSPFSSVGVCHNSIGSISISQHDIAAENRTTQVNSGMSFGTIDTQVFIKIMSCVHV